MKVWFKYAKMRKVVSLYIHDGLDTKKGISQTMIQTWKMKKNAQNLGRMKT